MTPSEQPVVVTRIIDNRAVMLVPLDKITYSPDGQMITIQFPSAAAVNAPDVKALRSASITNVTDTHWDKKTKIPARIIRVAQTIARHITPESSNQVSYLSVADALREPGRISLKELCKVRDVGAQSIGMTFVLFTEKNIFSLSESRALLSASDLGEKQKETAIEVLERAFRKGRGIKPLGLDE